MSALTERRPIDSKPPPRAGRATHSTKKPRDRTPSNPERTKGAPGGFGVKKPFLWLTATLAGLLAIAAALAFSPWFRVSTLTVTGIDGKFAEEVIQALSTDGGLSDKPMLLADLAAATEAVEAIPWVAHASLEKVWPDAVDVQITTQRPAAALVDQSATTTIVSSSGQLLSAESLGPLTPFAGNLVSVQLPEGQSVDPGGGAPSDIRNAVSAIQLLGPASHATLRTARLDPRGAITFEMSAVGLESPTGVSGSNNATVAFGIPEDLPAKALSLEAALNGSVDLSCLKLLDVSVPSRIVITRHPGCDTEDTDTEDR